MRFPGQACAQQPRNFLLGVRMGTSTFNGKIQRLLNRRVLLRAALVAVACGATGHAGQISIPKNVLFVCQYGTVKSAIAREVFRRRAIERRISVRVMSRGITPADHVSASLRQRLQLDGIDPARDHVAALDAATLRAADIVVLFDRLPPSLQRSGARDWSEMPSFSDYDRARGFLDPRIEALLTEVASQR